MNSKKQFVPRGIAPSPVVVEAVSNLLSTYGFAQLKRDELIEYAHVLQDTFQCIRQQHMVALASLLKIGVAEVFETLSFYHHFHLLDDHAPAPQLTVRICNSPSCQMAGGEVLYGALLDLSREQAEVRIEQVPCIGRCEQAPAACVGQREVGHASTSTVMALIEHKQTTPVALEPVENVWARYLQDGGLQQYNQLLEGQWQAEAVIDLLSHAGLRGLGGAGFPAGRKWGIVRAYPAPRLMAVNIDEGEPGTFKDRTCLENNVFQFLEGLLIAAHVVGIAHCYVYIRDEYHAVREHLKKAVAWLQAKVGMEIPMITIRRAAGSYVCGEESAMIESLEGKRGEPRLRPPYIAEKGLFGRPTLEHNMETLFWVPELMAKGANWFASHGLNGRKGLRRFSVSGRVKLPGVKLAPAGITARSLIEEYCGGMQEGHTLYAYLPGGASGGILPASKADIPLDFDTLQAEGCFIGSAAVIVLSQHDKARDVALNCMKFFAHESCGQCTPCRVGTDKAARLMESPVWDQATLNDIAVVMTDASICGLGQAAPNPMRCVQNFFSSEVDGSQP